MLLTIDIGNTDTVVGIFDENRLVSHFRMSSAPKMTVDEAGLFVSSLFNHHLKAKPTEISRAAVCSVVPRLTVVYEQMIKKYFDTDPLIISAAVKLPFELDYPDPAEIGADRLANAAAGFARYKSALVVVDVGTAITFDIISEDGRYSGGIITPGPQTAGFNLAQKAARLFEVRLTKPDRVVGKSTAEAIQSGMYYGTIGLIDNMLEKIFTETGKSCPVIGTGGDIEVFAGESKYISEVIPSLTLEGIKIIADCNKI
ncbi:MAG: type III pantothenate kinase [FCB group bacterium]|nr:type III pantothenate kinase [FCB group bacterium]